MSHLDYYSYQAVARGIKDGDDVIRAMEQRRYVYDRIVLPWLPVDRSLRLVDLACGHGSFLSWLKTLGYTRLAGVDSSPVQIELARESGAQIFESDVLSWLKAEEKETIDMLFAIDFIEHISKDDFMEFLALTKKVLKPGGILILRYPNGDSPFVGLNLFNDITHVWTYTTNCLRALGGMHGFARVDYHDEGLSIIRDSRWIKVPIAKCLVALMRVVIQGATRERISYWNSNIWARLHA